MIARLWTAEVGRAHARTYADHLKSQVLPTLRKIDGYIGARLLERETSNGVEIVVITLWQSLDAIAKFAGPDLEQAVVSNDILSLFLRYDQHVRHYNVVEMDDLQHG
jgi:heme-degrading monooxygenase HmoA